MDFQEDSASDVSPGLLVNLVISSHSSRFQAFPVCTIALVPGLPRLYRRGRSGTEAEVVSQLAPGRQSSIQAYYNFLRML